jgi:hypothetical protein
MIATGGVNDIIVHFFDGNGQRTFASSVGIFNDTQGSPSRIFLEGFDFVGQSLGRTQIDGASSGGTFSASGIYFAKIYGAPGYPLDLGVDNFSFTLGSTAVPEPTSIIVFGTGIVGLIGFRRCPKRVR